MMCALYKLPIKLSTNQPTNQSINQYNVCVQSTVDDVEGLLRRHDDFNSKLAAQNDRLKDLNALADRLIAEGHPDADQSVFFF
jgi:hypothetical protein